MTTNGRTHTTQDIHTSKLTTIIPIIKPALFSLEKQKSLFCCKLKHNYELNNYTDN